MFEVFSPDGDQVATFYSKHFLRCVMQEMFDLGSFDPLPVENTAEVAK